MITRTPYECWHGFTRGRCLAPACPFAPENAPRQRLTTKALRARVRFLRSANRLSVLRAIDAFAKHLEIGAELTDPATWQEAASMACHVDDLPRQKARTYLHAIWCLIHQWPWKQ